MTTRPNSADVAYRAIRRGIVSGEFATGSHLKEGALAENVGVSRTPIREALRRLAAEGVVRMIPNRGAYVVSLNDQNLEELFAMRAHMESFCAALAARKITDEAIGHLRSILDEMDDVASMRRRGWRERIAVLDREFHDHVVLSTENEALFGILGALQELPAALRSFDRYGVEQLERSFGHHRELVEALEAGNQEWAASVMKSHIVSALPVLYQETRTE